MSAGTVSGDRKIVVPIGIKGARQPVVAINAVMDTGFTGYLTLPSDALQSSKIRSAGSRRVELGDGSLAELNSYLVEVIWQGRSQTVIALESEAEPLLGMSMMWNNRVCFDAVAGGTVSIKAL